MTATNEELAYYGYPQRPTNKDKMKQWEKIVSTKWVKPSLTKTNIKHNIIKKSTNNINSTSATSNNWAGYVRNDECVDAAGSWRVPSVSAPGYLPAYSSQWTGLGGFGEGPLVQTGTESSINATEINYYPWYELIGTSYYTDYEIKIDNIPCKAGDQFYCTIGISRIPFDGSMDVYFYVSNSTQSVSTSFDVEINIPSNMPNSAEWITERPTINGELGNYPMTFDVPTGERGVPFRECSYTLRSESNSQLAEDSDSNMYKVMMQGNNTIATPLLLDDGEFFARRDGFN
ncbi:G1 family glutamic endopeptidase [uncultured Clostridium sp.]|uniref:G1 family glutamic endopeptidase n=1 Tax=uncultured Clostridium sp. TaxID=59620 RepID=UPI0025F44B4E|nr:G1 family glutamic endopeptidase [uncultured Clostridium sp.]